MIQDSNLIALVDENDNITSYEEKLEVHRKGLLHRAFSIFVFNSKNELLIHRRAFSKYHSGGLWTNTCCSHLHFGENFEESIHTRLNHEMGFDCDLNHVFSFKYHVAFDNGLIEHELDHVFVGRYDGNPNPNPLEVCDWQWVSIDKLFEDINQNKDLYTYWFKIALEKMPKNLLLQD